MDNIIFKLDKPNAEKSSILLVYRYSGRKVTVSTGVSIKKGNWDKKNQKVVALDDEGKPLKVKSAEQKQIEITANKQLEKCKLCFLSAKDHFVSQNNITPTVLQLKDKFNELFKGIKKDASKIKVVPFVEELQKSAKSKALSQRYSQFINLFKMVPNATTMEFQDLNLDKLESLIEKWKTIISSETGRKYSMNYIHKHSRTLVSIINKAKLKAIPVCEDYKSNAWRPKQPDGDFVGNDCILNEHEIKILEDAELSPRFDKIRDIFLIGYYVGQRFSDFIRLSKENIISERNQEYLYIVQQKTIKKVRLPVTNKLKNIFNKYDGYPPKMSSQKFNKALQELCKILKIDDTIITYRLDGDSEMPVESKVPKYEIVSSHTCRRSFCTNAILKGIPASTVMEISGHQNLKTLSQYIRINLENPDSDEMLMKFFGD